MESTETPFYLQVLEEVFLAKKEKNTRYSLRAYAHFLGINPGTLSAILKQKRLIPIDKISLVVKKLRLSEDNSRKFLKSLSGAHGAGYVVTSYELSAEKYRLVYEEWEYFVILALFRLRDFESSNKWISKKTNIPLKRVGECVENLFALKLIKVVDEDRWERTHEAVRSAFEVSSEMIRASHKNSLRMAVDKIDTVPMEERDYSLLTIGLDEKRFQRLKKLILKFRDEVLELDEVSDRQQLYRVSVQCFPLTKRSQV